MTIKEEQEGENGSTNKTLRIDAATILKEGDEIIGFVVDGSLNERLRYETNTVLLEKPQ